MTFTLLPLLVARPAAALLETASNQACQGIAVSDDPTKNTCDAGVGNKISDFISVALNGFSLVVGVVAVIMVIVGGLKYITSSGDSNSVNSAKNTILYALVGLAAAGLAQVLVIFVVRKL